jgi:hypothetical protein
MAMAMAIVGRDDLYRHWYIVGRAPVDSIVSLKRQLAITVSQRSPFVQSAFEHTQPSTPSWFLSKSSVLVWYVRLQISKGRRKQTPFVASALHVGVTFLQAFTFNGGPLESELNKAINL